MPTHACIRNLLAVAALLTSAQACAGGHASGPATMLSATLSPGSTPEEQTWVQTLNDAKASDPVERGGVVLGPIYYAASGRACRTVTSSTRQRLACTHEDSWYLVPSVFDAENEEAAVP